MKNTIKFVFHVTQGGKESEILKWNDTEDLFGFRWFSTASLSLWMCVVARKVDIKISERKKATEMQMR